ncbi:MAG: glycyl-radical enzyme activating protein [Bacillota bacterium]
MERDTVFFDESGGGVTFSGGEPLMQPAFLTRLLEEGRARGLKTAVDTTGFAPTETLLDLAPLVDLFLYDLKVMDERKHLAYTGQSNARILENLAALAGRHSNIAVRVPVIPGVNDDEENATRMGEFLASLKGVRSVSLLPYHRAGVDKYRRLGRAYTLPDLAPPGEEALAAIAARLEGSPQVVEGDEGLDNLAHLVRSYFRLGGHHIQFNVVSAATLREAQREPDKHRDLIVRVAGYSDYFCDLTRALQDEIIARTEHSAW